MKFTDVILGENFIDRWFEKKIDKLELVLKTKLSQIFASFFEVLLAVISISIVFYMLYQIIRFMFLGKNEDFQKILFSTFLLIMVRVTTVIIVNVL